MQGCFIAGADPELMLVDSQQNLVSAIGLVPGRKEDPHPVRKGAVQHDNVMAEFNIDPCSTSEEMQENIREVLSQLSDMVKPYSLATKASAIFPKSALEDEEALIFGCDPDFNAWTLSMNNIDPEEALKPFRSAGGHFHIGKTKDPSLKKLLDDPYGKIEVIKMLDIFQGIPSILLDVDPSSIKRRRLYGGAGAHRPKEYGVEYRSLGNFWVSSPELVEIMYYLADRAVALAVDKQLDSIIKKIGSEERVQEIINNSRRSEAKKVVKEILASYLDKDFLAKILASKKSLKEQKATSLNESWGI